MNTSTKCPNLLSSSAACAKSFLNQVPLRSFSSTQPRNARRITRQRRNLYRWLAVEGDHFRNPLPGSTNYLGAYLPSGQLKRVAREAETGRSGGKEETTDSRYNSREKANLPPETNADRVPFPSNRRFLSQPVLSEDLRELIWQKIMRDGLSVREVSTELRVEMSRVGAVVRLKEIEKEWERLGKPLARPYQQAVLSMLPKTEIGDREAHESINDLPVHSATGTQIFYPTSESRQFTRADAAKAFDEKLLPADDRIPHPELIQMHKELLGGIGPEERLSRQRDRERIEEEKKQDRIEKARNKIKVTTIDTPRWEFRFTEVNVDDIGKDGRGAKGTGWRYGRPLMDRKKGTVKIPTYVN